MSKTLEFLEDNKIDYVPASGSKQEVIISPCPFCGNDKQKFYLNKEKGVFQCKACEQKGNLFQLKVKYGIVEGVQSIREKEGTKYEKMDDDIAEQEHDALLKHPAAMSYLEMRGFNAETIEEFKLGYKSDAAGEWIGIPHYEDFDLWNIKYRRFAGGDKTFRRINGQPTVLFNMDNVDFSKNAVTVVESETDCMAAKQMGVTNVVGLTAGADTFKPEWLQFFNQFSHIYILLNTDEAGQKGARKVAEKIGLGKCKNMIIPTNDVNDYLMDATLTSADFLLEFSKTKRFDVKDISHVGDAVDSLEEWFTGDSNLLKGISTGFDALDNTIHGFQEEDLIVFTGDSGVGKTTFVNNMIIHGIYNQVPMLGFYLEGQFNYYLARMLGSYHDVEYTHLLELPNWQTIKNEAKDLPLYLYSGAQGGLDIDKMKEIITACVQLHDIKIVMIDNLQKFVRGEANYTRKVSDAVSVLKDIAVDLNITVLLVAHVRKPGENQKVITMHDLKDSSTIYQDADKILILQKLKDSLYLTVEKNRMGEGDINIQMNFDAPKGKFTETSGEVVKTETTSKAPRLPRD